MGTDLGLKTRQATDPENLARPALDGIVGADGVVRVARDGVFVQVGGVQWLGGTGTDPEAVKD